MTKPKASQVRWGFTGAALLAACLAGCGRGKVTDAASAPVAPVVKVTRQDLAEKLEISSEFQPYQEIQVYAKVSGYIQKLDVDWGTHVKQGQLLAVLEIPELEQQLQQDDASVHHSENDLDRAREQVHEAESAYKVSHLTYTRLTDVQKSRPGLISQEDIDVAEGKDLEGSAGLSAAKDAEAGAEQALAESRAALEKDKALYNYADIRAPFDGVVTELDAYTGALLPAGTSSNKGDQALCRLSQNDLLRLVIPVPERAVADIKMGEPIAVNVSALNKTLTGKIVHAAEQIDTETRTMHTEVEVPNSNYELVPGMYASVDIPLHTATQVLTLPLQAVQATEDGKGNVLVVNNDRIEKRAVTLGLETATRAEIRSGLQENDVVIFGSQGQYQQDEAIAPKFVTPQETE
jgi:RND family efflux transporter MFP subunit